MRKSQISRKTTETNISLSLNIDGSGNYEINSGIGFLDHMLTLFTRHGHFDITLNVKGDTYVDYHHSTEDIGIALGRAFSEALGNMSGINRYGNFLLPMDEALVLCAIDISGRTYLNYDVNIPSQKIGTFDTELVEEFLHGFTRGLNATLHIKQMAGKNSHHIAEAIFKGLSRALYEAVTINKDFITQIPSTKGIIDSNYVTKNLQQNLIAIIDYGVGNIHSLVSSLQLIGANVIVTNKEEEIKNAQKIILPSVGAFGDAINKLTSTGLGNIIKDEVKLGKPLLGICLGMQLLFENSTEYGNHKGLGLIQGSVTPFVHSDLGKSLKIPHMGWNKLSFKNTSPLLNNISNGDYVYYVHSYFVANGPYTIAVSHYGNTTISGIVQSGNVFGTQFHPEKSGSVGIQILKSYMLY